MHVKDYYLQEDGDEKKDRKMCTSSRCMGGSELHCKLLQMYASEQKGRKCYVLIKHFIDNYVTEVIITEVIITGAIITCGRMFR